MARYEPTANERIIIKIGQNLMDMSCKMPMKGASNEEIERSNKMSAFGDTLTRFGTDFGPKNLEDVLRISRVTKKEAEEFMKLGYTA